MASQSVRQAARRAALDAQARHKRARAERERRLSALGVEVVVALSERDAAIARFEQTAGEAVRTMSRELGVTLAEVPQWAAGVSAAEARRLRALAEREG